LSEVDILVKMQDQTGAASKSVTGNLKQMQGAAKDTAENGRTSFQKFSDTFGSVAGGIAKGAGFITAELAILKTAFDFGEEGAQVLQTGKSFDVLMEKVGASTDLLDQLRAASRGTIDDMKLMSSTTVLLSGTQGDLATALADSTPRLLEIAKAANKLNPALGDTTFMYESLALGIKRASPMILDNLGLTIKIGEANEDYAKQLGKTAEQLTAEEQKVALLNATLKAGDVLIDQVGGSVDSDTDSFARLDAATKNLADSFKAKLAPGLASAAETAALLLTWSDKLNAAYQQHEDEVTKTAASYAEFRAEMIRSAEAAGLLEIDQTTVEFEGMAAAVAEASGNLDIMSEAEWTAANHAQTMADMGYSAAGGVNALGQASLDAAPMVEDLSGTIDIFKAAIGGGFAKETDNFNTKMGELKGRTSELNGKIAELEGRSWLTAEQKENLEALRAQLDENGAAARTLAEEHERAMRSMAFNMIQQRAESDGLTENEVANLTTIAQEWGLWDQKTADVINSINENIGMLETDKPETFRFIIQQILDMPSEKTFKFHVKVDGADDLADLGDGGGGGKIPNPPMKEKAVGGPVNAGELYLVGERGPELFVPGASGNIIPNHRLDFMAPTGNGYGAGLTPAAPQAAPTSGAGGLRIENVNVYGVTNLSELVQEIEHEAAQQDRAGMRHMGR
jgi:protein-disulfide isomerase-like protein with CxxC motif